MLPEPRVASGLSLLDTNQSADSEMNIMYQFVVNLFRGIGGNGSESATKARVYIEYMTFDAEEGG